MTSPPPGQTPDPFATSGPGGPPSGSPPPGYYDPYGGQGAPGGYPPPGPGYPPPAPDPAAGYPPPGFGYPPPGPGYPPAGFGADPSAPFGRHPMTGEPYSDKDKLTAGLLQLFLGGVGAGRWYMGDTGIAIAQLLTCGGLGIWSLIDGIMMLTGNVRDKYGRPLRDN